MSISHNLDDVVSGGKYLNKSVGDSLVVTVNIIDTHVDDFNGLFTASSYSISPHVSSTLDVTGTIATITYDMSNAVQGDYTFTVVNAGFANMAGNSYSGPEVLTFTYDNVNPILKSIDISNTVISALDNKHYFNNDKFISDGGELVFKVDLSDNLTTSFDGVFTQSSYSLSPDVSSSLVIDGSLAIITYDMNTATEREYTFTVSNAGFTDKADNSGVAIDASLSVIFDKSSPIVVGDISANVETHNGTKYLNIDSLATQGNKLEIKVELSDNLTSDFNGLFTQSSATALAHM